MSEEKGMVSQEAVTATSADAGSIMPLAADLSRTQDVTTVSEVSTINSTDQFYMNQSGKFVQVDYSKLADAILGKISSKTYSLDQGTKTLIAAINELNSKMITNISQLITSYSVGKGSKEIQLSEGVYIVSTSQYGGWDQTNKSYLVFASSYPQTNKIVELDSFPSQWISATISDKGLLTVSNKSDASIFASVFKIGGANK